MSCLAIYSNIIEKTISKLICYIPASSAGDSNNPNNTSFISHGVYLNT